ncbi:PAS domain S-box protein [Aminipila butyrica]|uniref:PAS domain S-box protein n=1 Tax=Aminipila butyrica TaxID=433296 RepID=A0A858BWY5_9FIRM|nr:HD domain-containing phosphohydrolase [Aminipila butyrica]QIB70453.1 PAS domain S-box protein [Aminipila butyrica]
MQDKYTQNMLDILPFGIGYFKLLLNSNQMAVDYVFLDLNPAFEKLSGWKRTELLNKKASEVLVGKEETRQYWLSFYASVMQSGRTQEMIHYMKELKRYLSISVIPAEDNHFTIFLKEATPEAIRLNQQKSIGWGGMLDAIFDSSRDAVAMLEKRDGEYYYVRDNQRHQEATGFAKIEGLTPGEVFGPADYANFRQLYDDCLNSGRPAHYVHIVALQGQKRMWEIEMIPSFSQEGIGYLLLFNKDATDITKIQKENEELTQWLKVMFDQHQAMQLIYDPFSGEIVNANRAACQFYGYSKEELCSRQLRHISLLPPQKLEERFHRELMGYQYYESLPSRLKSGEVRLLDFYASSFFHQDRQLMHALGFDVTGREAYRSQMLQERDLLEITLRSIGDGVVVTDQNGIITSLNHVGEELTGWKREQAVGCHFSEVIILQSEETGLPVESPIQKVLQTGCVVELDDDAELISHQGKCIPIADRTAPLSLDSDSPAGAVMVFRDVSSEKQYNKQIEFLSYRDPLTGLYNRRYVEGMMNELNNQENLPLAIIMGDINGLKITNDVFGHQSGDMLLRSVAKLLRRSCKQKDMVARWGGDEFIIFMPQTGLKRAEEILDKLKNAQVSIEGSDLNVSLSLGCAVHCTTEGRVEATLSKAEEYMYHQKLLDGKSYRNGIINTLLATLYEKSNETEEHSKRMEEYCYSIGKRFQLSSKELNELSVLALLHDIGKVSIDPDILKKPGALNETEWQEMKRHPEIGYRIAQATPELATVSELILAHHERWDGTGYPRGIQGESIPLACRILAVTDAFDAMTNDRVYRKALNRLEAVCELERNAGTQFDPDIVHIFLELLQAEKEENGLKN